MVVKKKRSSLWKNITGFSDRYSALRLLIKNDHYLLRPPVWHKPLCPPPDTKKNKNWSVPHTSTKSTITLSKFRFSILELSSGYFSKGCGQSDAWWIQLSNLSWSLVAYSLPPFPVCFQICCTSTKTTKLNMLHNMQSACFNFCIVKITSLLKFDVNCEWYLAFILISDWFCF